MKSFIEDYGLIIVAVVVVLAMVVFAKGGYFDALSAAITNTINKFLTESGAAAGGFIGLM